MQNLKKIVSIWLILVSGISFAETIKEKADKGLFDRNLNITQTLTILGALADDKRSFGSYHEQKYQHRDNAIRVLLGNNATAKSYIKTPLSVNDATALLKGVRHRADLIAHLTHNKQITTPFSVDHILQLMNGVKTEHRSWVITNLANKNLVPGDLTPEQVRALLGVQNDTGTVSAITTLTDKELMQKDLPIKGVFAILGALADDKRSFGSYHEQKYQHRDNAIRVLLGNNATAKSYIKTPLSVNDATALLKGVRHRADLIAHLTHNKQITTPFSVDHILQLMNGVKTEHRSWVITNLANKNLVPGDLTPEQVRALLGVQNDTGTVSAITTLTDKELMQKDLPIKGVFAILGALADDKRSFGSYHEQKYQHRDNAIRVLMGNNATAKSYIKTPLSVNDATALLKGVRHRANLIAHLTHNKQITTPFSVDHILQLMNGVKTEHRSWVITNLANKNLVPGDLTPEQVRALLGVQNDTGTVSAITTLTDKELMQKDLPIKGVFAILGALADDKRSFGSYHEQKYQHRDNAIRVLLGNNATAKSYTKTPLSVNDATALLKGVRHRANLIAHLTHNKQITTPFSVDHILQLMNGVKTEHRSWVITNLANKNLVPGDLTPEQVRALLGVQNDTGTVSAITTLTDKELMQKDLPIKGVFAILGALADDKRSFGSYHEQKYQHRDNAIRVLLGNNATAKSYIKTPLSVDDATALLKGVRHRINLVKYMADYDLIQSGISESSVIELTDSNDVKFTNQVIKILSGENLIKKNYFDQFVALSEEEIKNKVIKKEFDTVIRILQSNENFVVYLLKHGYITTEMTIDQVSGLLLSQPTSQRLKTFTDIVNSGLLVSNLNRSDVDILIAAILGNNRDAKTQQSKEQITNTVIRLLEGNNSSSKVFFKSQTKDEVAEQEKIKAEVVEIIKVIQQVHFVDFDIVFEGNHWKLKEAAKRELNKLGAVLTSDALIEGSFELVGHVSGKGGLAGVCIDSKHVYTNNKSSAKECWSSHDEWSQVLSERRAESVKQYLIANYSINTDRLKTYGVGHSEHKFDDPDNPGNRRVEVKYIKK